MPVSSFLASIADKAQSAIHPAAAATSASSQDKHYAVSAIQNQLRAFGQQYTSATPVQKIITTEKSISIDFDSVSRNAKYQSKELYTWGQNEPEDLKDVTDRLAYLNFVQGSLASSLALKLDAARAPFKALRDAETNIAPRRNIRAGLQLDLSRIEHTQHKGMERKLAELKEQIRKAELDDEPQEKEIELLKRKAVRESEQLKWEAFREYGEKLVLLSQASPPIIGALPTLPPSESRPYTGSQATGAARASLQRALDNYKTGHINLPPQLPGADLHRSDTRSFGESHATELSSIPSDESGPSVSHLGIPLTPPPTDYKPPSQPPAPFKPLEGHVADKLPSTPINVANLNQAPAAIPPASGLQAPGPVEPQPLSDSVPSNIPTVAETGIPVSAGSDGPGPASGSLRDLRDPFPQPPGASVQSGVPVEAVQPAAADPHFESAEEEKKRLEREDRDRILRDGTSGEGGANKDADEDLPPKYQDF